MTAVSVILCQIEVCATQGISCLACRLEEAHNHTYLPFTDLSDTAKGRIQLGYTILCWLMPIFSALGIGAAAASLSGHSNDRDGGASDALHDTSGAVSHRSCFVIQDNLAGLCRGMGIKHSGGCELELYIAMTKMGRKYVIQTAIHVWACTDIKCDGHRGVSRPQSTQLRANMVKP